MRRVVSIHLMVLWVVLGVMTAVGQDDGSAKGFRPAGRDQRFTAAEALAHFEAPLENVYRMGAGDELTLEVWGRPELSGKHTIGPDGKVSLPLLGETVLLGLSREEAAELMKRGYLGSGLYKDVTVTVRVDKYTSAIIFILGRVANPGALEFPSQPTLLEAITRAGGLPLGDYSQKTALTRCALIRGRDRIAWINLKPMLTEGDLTANLRLQRNDMIYIPDADDQLVYVMGEVHKPGAYRMTPDMSFMDALTLAGGPTKDAGQKLRLIRGNREINIEIDFRRILAAQRDTNYLLEEGDVIYVDRSGLARFGYVIEKFSPLSYLLLLGATLRD